MKRLRSIEKMLLDQEVNRLIIADEHPEPCKVCGFKFCTCPMTEEEKATTVPKGTF